MAVTALFKTSSGHGREKSLTSSSGARAEIVEQDGVEILQVRDTRQRVVFRFDPQTGQGELCVPKGDLNLHAPEGNINLLAGKGVQCRAAEEIVVQSNVAVRLSAREPGGDGATTLKLGPNGLLQLAARKMEATVETLVERARNSYRYVEQLSQVHAGRMRKWVKGAYHQQSGQATIKAEDKVKIRARRIHLG
ncbi:MAG TPA: DUF3540 domain-containing protein [Gammaproteobacteria bacterium]|nr:DUF3540 domain-containing protein [Gammaproteobacteria bacterium]